MLATFRESHTHFSSKSGKTHVYMYIAMEETALNRFIDGLLADNCYFLKQKFLGLVALGTVAAEFILGYMGMIDGGGAFLFLLPVGLYALFGKNKMCNF